MFLQRLFVSLVLTPLALWLIFAGGWPYLVALTFLMSVAGWEFANLFKAGGFRPAGFFIVLGVAAFMFGRYMGALNGAPFANDAPMLVGVIFLVTTYYIIAFERGSLRAGTDMLITFGGIFYVGFLSSYLLILRALPNGEWWSLVTLPAVWLIDSGAYLVGRQWGRHRFSPHLSPKKTWEGFLGGVLAGTLGNALLCMALQAIGGEAIGPTPLQSGIIGFTLAILTPLGDLGKSMFKRQVGVKDSGNLLPGHGGAFDRVDTWLWAGAIGYYLITWFFQP